MAEQNIKCPHCNSELTLDEEYMGMEVECPACNQNFVAAPSDSVITPKVVATASPEGQEESAGFGNNFKNKLGNLYSDARKKLDEAQQLENERFEGSSQIELFNKVRQGGIYRKIWQIITPATAAVILFCSFAAELGIKQGSLDADNILPVCLCCFFACGIVMIFQHVLFSSIKKQTDKKIFDGDLASTEQIERKKLAGIFSSLTNWFQPVSSTMYQLWCDITNQDQQYLNELDILPRFGKNQSQLIAESHTLFSPVLESFRLDENSNFLYPQENVTKLYTFEDQLVIFTAVWDYTTGNLFDESSSAFFFTEICDISTSTNYDDKVRNYYKLPENIRIKPFKLTAFLIVAAVIFGIISCISFSVLSYVFLLKLAVDLCLSSFFISMICLLFDLVCLKKIIPLKVTRKTKVKQSETFTITARSGKSTGITIVCDEWIEANNGKFTRRTDAEKIIQAIRKMIEEKKVAADA